MFGQRIFSPAINLSNVGVIRERDSHKQSLTVTDIAFTQNYMTKTEIYNLRLHA